MTFVRSGILLCLLGVIPVVAAEAPTTDLAAGSHGIEFLYGRNELFPSAIVSLTGFAKIAPRDPTQLGDPRGIIAAKVVAPANGSLVRVTLAATPFFAESTAAEILPVAGRVYRVAPTIRFHNEKLAAMRQPFANLVIKLTVEIAGQRHEHYRQIVVRSIHDCVLGYRLRPDDTAAAEGGRELTQLAYLFAAYVNENHPVLDQTITKNALRGPAPLVTEFVGYLKQGALPLPQLTVYVPGATSSVRTEVRAIFESLQGLGFKYADLGVPPAKQAAANGVVTHSVRLVGEIVESRQANELEAAVVMASVLQKMSVDTVLYILPERRALLGVYLAPGRRPSLQLVLDLQYLGTGTFAQAEAAGAKAYAAFKEYLGPDGKKPVNALTASGGPNRFLTIDLKDARDSGVLPIPEAIDLRRLSDFDDRR